MDLRLPVFIFLFIGLLYSCDVREEEFEGRIDYHQQLISKNPAINEVAYNRVFGNRFSWYYKKGQFKEMNDGTGNRGTFYIGGDEVFTLFSDSTSSRNINQETRTLDTLYISNETEEVLGHECQKVVKIINGVKHTYWVSDFLQVNPEHFKNYNASFLNEFYNLTRAHYLKYEYESDLFRIERRAIDITQTKLGPGTFDLAQ